MLSLEQLEPSRERALSNDVTKALSLKNMLNCGFWNNICSTSGISTTFYFFLILYLSVRISFPHTLYSLGCACLSTGTFLIAHKELFQLTKKFLGLSLWSNGYHTATSAKEYAAELSSHFPTSSWR